MNNVKAAFEFLHTHGDSLIAMHPDIAEFIDVLPPAEPKEGTEDAHYVTLLYAHYRIIPYRCAIQDEAKQDALRVLDAYVAQYRRQRMADYKTYRRAEAGPSVECEYGRACATRAFLEMQGNFRVRCPDLWRLAAALPAECPRAGSDAARYVSDFVQGWRFFDTVVPPSESTEDFMAVVNRLRAKLAGPTWNVVAGGVCCGVAAPARDAAAFRAAQRELIVKPGGLLDRILAEAHAQMADLWPRAAVPLRDLKTDAGLHGDALLFMWAVVKEELEKRSFKNVRVTGTVHHWGCDWTSKTCTTPAKCRDRSVFEW